MDSWRDACPDLAYTEHYIVGKLESEDVCSSVRQRQITLLPHLHFHQHKKKKHITPTHALRALRLTAACSSPPRQPLLFHPYRPRRALSIPQTQPPPLFLPSSIHTSRTSFSAAQFAHARPFIPPSPDFFDMGLGGSARDMTPRDPTPSSSIRARLDMATLFNRVRIAFFISGWFIFSLASLFLAKHVLHVFDINEAVFTLWQFGSSVLFGLILTKILRFQQLAILGRGQLRAIVPLSVAFLIKEMLKYASLARVSVNLVNTIRSLGPLFNVCLELCFFRHTPPASVVWALLPIIIGVALTSIDEIHSASVSSTELFTAVLGFLAAVLSTAINNAQNIYSKILFGRERIDPVSLQIYLSAISLLIMCPISVVQMSYHVMTADSPVHKLFAPSWLTAAGLVLAGFINFVASQLAFNTLNLISPLSYSVANTFKRVCIAVIAIFYFNERLSVVNGIGIAISIIGVFIYERKSRALKEARMYRKLHSEAMPRTVASLPTRKQTASGPDLVKLAVVEAPNPGATEIRQETHQNYVDVTISPETTTTRNPHANVNSRP